MRVSDIPQDLSTSILFDLQSRDVQYNPETGALLYGPGATPGRRGKPAGTPGVHGGRYVVAFGTYKLRGADVAWLLHYGAAPRPRVLCLNGQAGDLRLSNLRETSDPMQRGRPATLDLLVRTGKLHPDQALGAQKGRERRERIDAAGGEDRLFSQKLNLNPAYIRAKCAAARGRTHEQAKGAPDAPADVYGVAVPDELPDLF